VKIEKAAEMLGVEVQTLRTWEASGELIPDRRSKGRVRYYDIGKIMGLGNEDMPAIGYARVSSHDQKNDLVRQQGSRLMAPFEIIRVSRIVPRVKHAESGTHGE
jgi:putative resolvase